MMFLDDEEELEVIYTFYCRDCGETFVSKDQYNKYCPYCNSNNIIPIEGE